MAMVDQHCRLHTVQNLMRLHGRIIALTSAVALSASSTPASAFESRAPSGPIKPAASVAAQHHSGSPEPLLGLAAGGGIALLGTGLIATRQRRRPARTDSTPTVTPSS